MRQPKAAAWMILDIGCSGWRYALVAFTANVISALFEGCTLGILTLSLRVLSVSSNASLQTSLGGFGNWLDGLQLGMGREHLFLSLVLLAIGAQILRSAFQFAAEAASVRLQVAAQAEGYRRIFTRILRLPFPRVISYRLGDLTDYLSQARCLHDVFGRLNELARTIFLVLVYTLLLLWLSWPMTLAVLVVYWCVSHLFRRIMTAVVRHAASYTQTAVALSQKTTESLQAIRLLHAFARQEETIRSVHELTQKGVSSRRKATLWANTVEPITDVFTVFGAAVFLVAGYVLLAARGVSTLPNLLAFLMALYRLMPRLRSIHAGLAVLASLTPNLSRMEEILSQDENDRNKEENLVFPGLRVAIEFRQMVLNYRPGEPPAVIGLTFQVPKGSFTALVGASGAGKSTIVDLLLRLFDPTSGQIVIDGVDLVRYDRVSWRNRLGVVAQEPFLFHSSIRENIAFGKPQATMKEIIAAAQEAYADEFIARLADGYETVVGDRGHRLSGGQCQRIALARALVRQPDILILDEATSNLDSESERLIQRSLNEQRGTRTILAIAHRLSTIADADQILVLAQGRLVEQGTHPELLQRNGIYARLWRLQSEGREAAWPVEEMKLL